MGASNINLFRQPELVPGAKALRDHLDFQIRAVGAFNEAKKRLEAAGSGPLDHYLLDACVFFAEAVHTAADTNCVFEKEVSSLSRDGLMFCCIAFKKRHIPLCHKGFKVEHVRSYMASQSVTCGDRGELSQRLLFYGKKYPGFGRAFEAARIQTSVASKTQVPALDSSVRYDYSTHHLITETFTEKLTHSL